MKGTAVLCVLGLATVALACYNDRDSLYFESQGQTDVVKAIEGWFPVHTKLYYQMRIKHGLKVLAKQPNDWPLYDDVAVAYAKLGEDGKAIEIIERKKVQLVKAGIQPHIVVKVVSARPTRDEIVKSSMDPWYRYYANAGTFWVHRWFQAGMPKNHRDWLDTSQADIDEAVHLNPYAHGLREFAQAEMIRWIRLGKPGQTFYDFAGPTFFARKHALPAIAGLVELGGAWESPDVFETISQACRASKDDLAYFAFLRVQELQIAGKRSATGLVFGWQRPFPGNMRDDERDYVLARRDAKDYRRDLASYETPRLQAGEHPDWNSGFWKDYKAPEMTDIGRTTGTYEKIAFVGALVLILAILVALVWLPVWWFLVRDPNRPRK